MLGRLLLLLSLLFAVAACGGGSEETTDGGDNADASEGGEAGSAAGADDADADASTTETTDAETEPADAADDDAAADAESSDDEDAADSDTAGSDVGSDAEGSTDGFETLPVLGDPPPLLADAVPDAILTKTDEKITERGTYELTWNFDTDLPLSEACEAVTANAIDAGFVLETDACASDFDSRLSNGDTDLKFFGLEDRGFMTFVQPTPLTLEEAIDINRPTNLTIPPLAPKWLERTTTADRVETEFVFEDDGNYLEHCENTVAELTPLGFEASNDCELGSGTNIEGEGAFDVRVSSTVDDTVFYLFKIDRDIYNDVVVGG